MINIPNKCDGDISLEQIQNVFYYNSPNNFDIVYDDITQKIGFGKKWDDDNDDDVYGTMFKPDIPSNTQFTLCFERCTVDPSC